MATVRTDVLEELKYTYGTDRLLYLANEEVSTYNLLKKNPRPVGGRGQFLMPIIVKNPGTFKGVVEAGTIPSAAVPDLAEASFALKEFVGIYDLSWRLIQDARNSEFAFEQAVKFMDQGIKRRIFRLINADLIDNGKGRLGVLTAADDSTVLNVNALPSVEPGMVVDIMDLSDDDAKIGDSRTVTAVNTRTREVTISGANLSGSAAGDYIVLEDTTDATTNGAGGALHMQGLLSVVDDANPAAVVGNFGGISRATAGNEYWQATVFDNSGTNRPFTEDLGIAALDAAREKGGGNIDAWISNLNIARRYHSDLRADTFYSLNREPGPLSGGLGRPNSAQKMDGNSTGATPYEFCGVQWYADPYFAANTLVGLDRSHFFLGVGENEVPRPISEVFDDVPFFKQTTATTFEVVWYWQANLLSDNPASAVKIEDIAEA